MKRRDFLIGSASVYVGTTMTAGLAGAGKASAQAIALTRDDYAGLVGSTFHLRTGPLTTVGLQLADVKNGPESPELDQFSLIFRGPASPRLAAGTYTVSESPVGRSALFIVPGQTDGSEQLYVAAFSLLR